MELKNTSCLPDHFVRAMLRWCCKQVGYSYSDLREARFTDKNYASQGSAWLRSRRIAVHVYGLWMRDEKLGPFLITYDEAITLGAGNDILTKTFRHYVDVTAHEIAHLYVYQKYGTASEQEVEAQGAQIADDFAANADSLLAAWSKEPARRESKPKPTTAEKREQGNRELLTKWERKLKAAQNKVKKYRVKVRYYDRKRAAKKAEK